MAEYGSDLQIAPDAGNDTGTAYSKKPRLSKDESKAVKERLRCANRYYETCFKENAQRSRDLYSGYHWPKGTKKNSHCPVINYLKFVADTQVAAIAFKRGEVILKPESPQGELNKDKSNRAADYGYRKAEAHRECRRALADSRVVGFGVVHTHWKQETKTAPAMDGRLPVEGEPLDPAVVLAAIEAGEAPPATPPIPQVEITADYPCCQRIDPRQFRISPEADWVIENASYCGYVEVRPLDEVKADPRFRKGVTRRLKGNAKSLRGLLSDEYQDKEDQNLPADVKRVELWHYYEKRRQIHVIFAEEDPEPIFSEAWDWEHGQYPFRLIFDPLLEDAFYPPVPPMMALEHMQKEINESRGQLATHRRRYNRQYIAVRNAFDKKAEETLKAGEDGAIVWTNAQSATGALEPVPSAQMQAEVYESFRAATQDLMTLSATDQYQFGQAPTKRVTTTEAEAIQGAGGALKADLQARYEALCGGVAEQIFKLMQQYSYRTMMLPIYSEQDQLTGWDPISKDEIQGDYEFEIAVGSTEILNNKDQFKDLGFFIQGMMPFFQMGVANPQPFVEAMLKLIPDIKNVAAIAQPPPGMGLPPPPGGDAGMGGAPVPQGPMPMGGAPTGGAQIPPELLAALGGVGG